MSTADIGIYLSDHLAGSTAAIQLLQHLKSIKNHANREKFLTRLCAEVEEDQKTLEDIMSRLHVSQSTAKHATSWLVEKIARLKLWLDQSSESNLFWFEALEAIALGVNGKLQLWRALMTAPIASEIGLSQLDELNRRAISQRGRIEKFRLVEAKVVLRRSES